MPRSKSNNNNWMGTFLSPHSQQLQRIAFFIAILGLECLSLGSCILVITPQTQGETAMALTSTGVASAVVSPASGTSTVEPTMGMPSTAVTSTSMVYLPIISKSPPAWVRTYYVDSSLGSDQNTCTQAQQTNTPKKTVEGVMSCNPGPGQTVRFRGEFKETIYPNRNGTVLYGVEDITQVDESVVTFKQNIAGIYPPTDYVTIYGSRKGNSGAFRIISLSGNQVTVDTSELPGGKFLSEAASDPGNLQAAILRPVHFTAWDKNNPPVWTGQYQAYHAINTRVAMVSHLKSESGEAINPGWPVWAAFKIDGSDFGNSDFQIFDHLEVINAECAIAIESHEFQSNYDILQYNNLHDIGSYGTGSDEIIYFGFYNRADLHHDYVQIMYNTIGPHNANADLGDGIDVKLSARSATIFGNEIVGINPAGCDDAPIKIDAINAFVANNYVHDINPQAALGCGISIVDGEPLDPTMGGDGAIVVNNIIANVKGVGIRVIDTSNVQIFNNTIYNIFPEPNCDPACLEQNMGIGLYNWQGPTQNIVIKNNIVMSTYIGIGRYIWSHDEYPVSIDSDYNIVFDVDFPFRGTITKNQNDLIIAPGFVDPQNNNFTLTESSPAWNSGIDLSNVFRTDNHDAADASLPTILSPIIRISPWDRGAYEH